MLYLAENLRKCRLIKNLTQEDVAEYLGITPQSVSKWERGETYPDITLLPGQLPHMRESREEIAPVIASNPDKNVVFRHIKCIILGE